MLLLACWIWVSGESAETTVAWEGTIRRHTITAWHRKLLETSSLVEKLPCWKRVAEQLVDTIQQDFQRSPSKPVRCSSRELAIFQQDGAPHLFALHIRDHLDDFFPQRWIGRGGTTAWPPGSPDLTPMVFFYWGYIKDIAYCTPVWDLCRRILAACELSLQRC